MPNKNENIQSIKTRIEAFCKSFDTKDWVSLRECLAETVFTDYASFRGTKPGNSSSGEFVMLRKNGLRNLTTKHLTNNFQITFSEQQATCHCDFVIQRFDTEGSHFHSYGHYIFLLAKIKSSWKITSIKQVVIRNEGDASIHGAFQKN